MEALFVPLSFVAGTLLAVQAGANTYMYGPKTVPRWRSLRRRR